MPKWLKVTMIIAGSLAIVLAVGGFFAAGAVKRGIEGIEMGVEQAAADGGEFGAGLTPPDCVEEGVQRTAGCGLTNLACAPLAGGFLWGCLGAAEFDRGFCNAVPEAEDNNAVIDWSRRACTVHGQHGNEYCTIALAVVPGFCSARLAAR